MIEGASSPSRKVFGIGLSRTGTTSLTIALDRLGYRAVHYPDPGPLLAGDFGAIDAVDAATDTPIAALFPLLDQRYPGSRFVLTLRAMDAWLESVGEHFRRHPEGEQGPAGAVRRLVYGRETFDGADFRVAYERHVSWVRGYFARRPNDLLEMDITAGAGWEALCGFLGVSIPDGAFPRENRRPEPRLLHRPIIIGPGIPFGGTIGPG